MGHREACDLHANRREDPRVKGTSKVEKVQKVSGPSVPQMGGNEGVSESVQKRVQEIFEKRLTHETEFLLKK